MDLTGVSNQDYITPKATPTQGQSGGPVPPASPDPLSLAAPKRNGANGFDRNMQP